VTSVRPNHLSDQNFDHDYQFKLRFQGAGCQDCSYRFQEACRILTLTVTSTQTPPEYPYCRAKFDGPGVVRFKDSFRCPSCGIELQVSYAYRQLIFWISAAVATALCLSLHLRGGSFLLGFLVFLLPSVFSVTLLLGRVYPPKLVLTGF
jgi:hypothetical protein